MPKLALLADPLDEGWHSMDLCAEMLAAHVASPWSAEIHRPEGARVARRVPGLARDRRAALVDRLLTRFVRAPQAARRLAVRRLADRADAYHVVDHSYAHLVHRLPRARTGVYCHDLDAFRSVLDPERDRKPRWFRRLAGWQLSGLRLADVVFHNSLATRDELLRHALVAEERLVHAPLGVAPEFTPQATAGDAPPEWLASLDGAPYVLHVGSCIARKRIDVLLDVVTGLTRRERDIRLLKIGGEWTPAQRDQLRRLAIESAVVHVSQATRSELAHAYRGAAAVLVPSESEGYGLPVIEAMACGAPVVASDIAVLREVGGDGCLYAPVADTEAWIERTLAVLDGTPEVPGVKTRLAAAGRHSWRRHAEIITGAYTRLLN